MGQTNVFDVLQARGFMAQTTGESQIRSELGKAPQTIYVGYDPTADSLHVGHLLTLMALAHFRALGHHVIVLLGGGTAMVGDPSGKSEMRPLLLFNTIQENAKKISQQVHQLLPQGSGKLFVENNADWLLGLNYIEFLRDVGKHFSVNRMLTAESYKIRMEKGLSFLEFNYQILQAYDFLELYKRHHCRFQMGGDDQWSNILAGVDLCRRLAQGEVYGITVPLLLTSVGEKMGKTAKGAVWLDLSKLPAYDYYQYWVNLRDDDIQRMLAYFTFLPMDEIKTMNINDEMQIQAAKRVLAYEATLIAHGQEQAVAAHHAAMSAFGKTSLAAAVLPSSRMPRDVSTNIENIPSMTLESSAILTGIALVDLVVNAQLSDSKRNARRLLEQGGIMLQNQVINDVNYQVSQADFSDNYLLLKAGKKKIIRIVLK